MSKKQKLVRRHHSSLEDRKHALRDLTDVLEYLRPQVKGALSRKDETELFNIIDNFGIRHHNPQQKTDYDASIWCSWMFYFFLANDSCVRTAYREEETRFNLTYWTCGADEPPTYAAIRQKRKSAFDRHHTPLPS